MFVYVKQILWGALFGTLIATQAMGQASLLPNGVQQYLDQNGAPIASGHVDYFIPNTTTRKTTWSSSTEGAGTQNPNPVLLNAGGFPQNGSGQTSGTYGDGIYRQRVVDQNGNTIWDATTSSTGSGGGGGGLVALGDNAYVGDVHAYAGVVAPTNYMFAAGQAISRTTYAALMSAITLSITITCSFGSPTISGMSDTSQINIGAPLEATCFPPNTTVLSKTSSSVTMSRNATTSTTVTGIFFPWGNGNGSTLFNVPDLRGLTIVGRDNLGGTAAGTLTTAFYGQNPDALGAITGVGQSRTLITANFPPYTPAGTITNGAITNGAITNGAITTSVLNGVSAANVYVTGASAAPATGGALGFGLATLSATSTQGSTTQAPTTQGASTFAGVAQGGASTPISIIQPSVTFNYIIKVQADTISSGLIGVTATLPLVVTVSNAVANISLTNPLPVANGGTGGSSWTARGPLLGNGTSPFTQGIPSGNTSTFATTSGLLNSGHCVQIDASGNLVDSGTTGCGGGGSASSPVFQIFSTPGAVTTLTLTTTPVPTSSGVVSIAFDGVIQARNTWSINIGTSVITFNSAIPTNVQQVEVDWWAPLSFTITGVAVFQNVAALRSNSAVVQTAYVQGYSSISDGGEGYFNYIPTDITSTDNGGTIIVDAGGHRWYRSFPNGEINIKWFGNSGLGGDDTAVFQAAINVARSYGQKTYCVLVPQGGYVVSSLDASAWQNGCIKGGGVAGSVLIFVSQASSKEVFNKISSPDFLMTNLVFLSNGSTVNGTAVPTVGLLEAGGPGLADTDLDRFQNVTFDGNFSISACYVYSVPDDVMSSVDCVNTSTAGNTTSLFVGNTNVFGVTSSYAPIGTDSGVMGDFTWDGGAGGAGNFSGNIGALQVYNCSQCRFRDGVFGGSAGNSSSAVIRVSGTGNNGLLFEGIQLNSNIGTATNIFWLENCTVTEFTIINIDISNGGGTTFMGGTGSPTITAGVILGVPQANLTGAYIGLFSAPAARDVSSTVANTTVGLTSNTAANVTSISLPPGDWEVSGNVFYIGNAATVVSYGEASVNTTSTTRNQAGSNTFYAGNITYFGTINGLGFTVAIPTTHLNLSTATTNTTVYLIAFLAFNTNTATAGGTISARRL